MEQLKNDLNLNHSIGNDSSLIRLINKVLILTVLFYGSVLSAQDVVSIDYILASEPLEIKEYNVNIHDTNLLVLPFDYADSKADVNKFKKMLSNVQRPIERIDFVYTHYRVSESFNQEKLNRARLEIFRKAAPYVFDNNLIEWKFYEQVNELSLDQNKKLFHGFVIHFLDQNGYTGNNGKLTTEEEIKEIEKLLKTFKSSSTERTVGEIRELPTKYVPILKRKRKKGILYDSKFLWIWRKKTPVSYDTTWIDKTIGGKYGYLGQDTVVLRTLRNYEDVWKCSYVVEDVTGSMYPYIAQTLAWKKMRLDSSLIEHFVFFNDGDSKPDGPIGRSGGAYYIKSHDFEEIGNEISRVMRKGSGGMGPENNVEATLFAEKKYDQTDSYILIADNWAPIRDMKISNKIEKPTHIILCGVRGGKMHHSYIKLALETGGTLHTIEEDIDDIRQMKPGDIFKMGKQKWKYLGKGKIILVR